MDEMIFLRTEGRREFTLVGLEEEGVTAGHHFNGSPKLPTTGGLAALQAKKRENTTRAIG